LDAVSAFGGSAITLQNNSQAPRTFGQHGAAFPSNAMNIFGQFGTTINIGTAPLVGNAVINVGGVSNTCSEIHAANCFLFNNYDGIRYNNGQFGDHFDQNTGIYSWFVNGNNAVSILTASPTQIASNITHILENAQFEGVNASGAVVPETQFRISSIQGHYSTPSVVPISYDAVIGTPVLVSTTVPAGSSQNFYFFNVHLPGGDTQSPFLDVFNQNNNPPSGGTNTISCSVVPTGATADLWLFLNPGYQQVTGQTCSGPSGTVADNGSAYGANTGNINTYSAGAELNSGSFTANGFRGFYGFTQQDNFAISNPAYTITASINQTAPGVLSVNTGTTSNGLGSIHAGGGIGPAATVLWTSGSGAPSGACSNGSLYTSTTGTTTNILWACGSSAWQLVH